MAPSLSCTLLGILSLIRKEVVVDLIKVFQWRVEEGRGRGVGSEVKTGKTGHWTSLVDIRTYSAGFKFFLCTIRVLWVFLVIFTFSPPVVRQNKVSAPCKNNDFLLEYTPLPCWTLLFCFVTPHHLTMHQWDWRKSNESMTTINLVPSTTVPLFVTTYMCCVLVRCMSQ